MRKSKQTPRRHASKPKTSTPKKRQAAPTKARRLAKDMAHKSKRPVKAAHQSDVPVLPFYDVNGVELTQQGEIPGFDLDAHFASLQKLVNRLEQSEGRSTTETPRHRAIQAFIDNGHMDPAALPSIEGFVLGTLRVLVKRGFPIAELAQEVLQAEEDLQTIERQDSR